MHDVKSTAELADLIQISGSKRIALDGNANVGKTPIADELGGILALPVIHLDTFLNEHQNTYIAALNLNNLGELTKHDSWLIEGVCLLQVLDMIDCKPDLHIYVRHISYGTWSDEEELEVHGTVDEHLAARMALMQPMAERLKESCSLPHLTEEIIRYHAAYHPHEHAAITYLQTRERN